ncbi:hypothetical protein EC973_005552 [Apophysomyces ossiformis]|uniref:L-dopachrome isomerase n=1 Tax=Apophysomyces ossiformis TaxID=679940 RepID=A0A8H7BEX5_9FUNG|nr:hypothetical protein EC973_005552 [Apophysomyces ossiformis]
MPILEIVSQTAPQDLNSFIARLSKVFAEAIDRPEAYCLVTFQKVDALSFAGNQEPGFLVKVGSIGNVDNDANASLTNKVSEVLLEELKTSNDRGYFWFTDLPASDVGFKGTTFANLWKQ